MTSLNKEQKEARYLEYLKLTYDLAKHHTTLSTVTAALIAGLFQDSFKADTYPTLLLVALILLGISAGLAVVAMVRVTKLIKRTETRDELPRSLTLLHVLIVGSMLIAIGVFAWYVFRPMQLELLFW